MLTKTRIADNHWIVLIIKFNFCSQEAVIPAILLPMNLNLFKAMSDCNWHMTFL